MLISTALLAAIVIVLIGGLIFWSNPQRLINRFFLAFSLHLAAWLACVHFAVTQGEDPYWIRMASAVAAFVPLHMWLLKEKCISHRRLWERNSVRVLCFWIGAGALLAATCFTPWYVLPRESLLPAPPRFGPAYLFYMIAELALFAMLWRQSVLQLRVLHGLGRLELQILLVGVSAAAFAIILLMALRAILHAVWPIHLQPLCLLAVYSATVIAITTHRIFDARQIVLLATQKAILISVAALLAYLLDQSLEMAGLPPALALLVTVGLTLWFVGLLREWLDRIFKSYPEAGTARRAAFAAAQREARLDSLQNAFASVLKGWGHCDHALILCGAKGPLTGGGMVLAEDCAVLSTMRTLRWATPERLARERATPDRDEIGRFLQEQGLGVLVFSEGPALTILVGVGTGASRLPITYPQVTQLLELASIFESAFERVHFSVKAQHAEQLATVGLLGASLAHEIRNPLVSIKTFVQLLPNHHQDPAFRAKFFRLISDEVTRIDQLTEQLLDLASPRMYSADMIDLHPVLRASLDLVEAKAVHRNVQLLTNFEADPDRAYTDASAAKQVMLNLCFNAIQAVESRENDRWIKISTRNTREGLEMAVEDNGPGISPEIRPRLFQPFQTTKSTGFGLGLAICSDILSNLNATISVDPPSPGCGAAFRVTFPCQPLSS